MPSINIQQALNSRKIIREYRVIIDNPKADIRTIGYQVAVNCEAIAREALHRAYDRMTENEKAEIEAILSA